MGKEDCTTHRQLVAKNNPTNTCYSIWRVKRPFFYLIAWTKIQTRLMATDGSPPLIGHQAKNRYQLDRKMTSGINILGLRTLELSTVQGVDAATYRPSDGGENMRQ